MDESADHSAPPPNKFINFFTTGPMRIIVTLAIAVITFLALRWSFIFMPASIRRGPK